MRETLSERCETFPWRLCTDAHYRQRQSRQVTDSNTSDTEILGLCVNVFFLYQNIRNLNGMWKRTETLIKDGGKDGEEFEELQNQRRKIRVPKVCLLKFNVFKHVHVV